MNGPAAAPSCVVQAATLRRIVTVSCGADLRGVLQDRGVCDRRLAGYEHTRSPVGPVAEDRAAADQPAGEVEAAAVATRDVFLEDGPRDRAAGDRCRKACGEKGEDGACGKEQTYAESRCVHRLTPCGYGAPGVEVSRNATKSTLWMCSPGQPSCLPVALGGSKVKPTLFGTATQSAARSSRIGVE